MLTSLQVSFLKILGHFVVECLGFFFVLFCYQRPDVCGEFLSFERGISIASIPLIPVVAVALIIVVVLPWPLWPTAVSSDMALLIAVEADEIFLPVVIL